MRNIHQCSCIFFFIKVGLPDLCCLNVHQLCEIREVSHNYWLWGKVFVFYLCQQYALTSCLAGLLSFCSGFMLPGSMLFCNSHCRITEYITILRHFGDVYQQILLKCVGYWRKLLVMPRKQCSAWVVVRLGAEGIVGARSAPNTADYDLNRATYCDNKPTWREKLAIENHEKNNLDR